MYQRMSRLPSLSASHPTNRLPPISPNITEIPNHRPASVADIWCTRMKNAGAHPRVPKPTNPPIATATTISR